MVESWEKYSMEVVQFTPNLPSNSINIIFS